MELLLVGDLMPRGPVFTGAGCQFPSVESPQYSALEMLARHQTGLGINLNFSATFKTDHQSIPATSASTFQVHIGT